jgi:hypothetical protein
VTTRYRRTQRWLKRNFWPAAQVMATVTAITAAVYISRVHATEEAARAAQERSDRSARVQTCFDANAQAPVTHRFLVTLQAILENQITSTKARIRVEGSTPQLENVLRRATTAVDDVRDFGARAAATTPTARECRQLAVKLGVKLP